MANNYELFAEMLEMPVNAAQDLAQFFAVEADTLPEWFLQEENITPDGYGEWLALQMLDTTGTKIEVGPELQDKPGNVRVYVTSEECGDLYTVAYFLSEIMNHYEMRIPYVLNAAFICSKMRPCEFGGYTCVVGPGMIDTISGATWGEKRANTMRRKIRERFGRGRD